MNSKTLTVMLIIHTIFLISTFCILGIMRNETKLNITDQYITCSECKAKVNFTQEIAPLFTDEVIIDRNLNYHSIECSCGRKWSVNFKEE